MSTPPGIHKTATKLLWTLRSGVPLGNKEGEECLPHSTAIFETLDTRQTVRTLLPTYLVALESFVGIAGYEVVIFQWIESE